MLLNIWAVVFTVGGTIGVYKALRCALKPSTAEDPMSKAFICMLLSFVGFCWGVYTLLGELVLLWWAALYNWLPQEGDVTLLTAAFFGIVIILGALALYLWAAFRLAEMMHRRELSQS